MYYNPQRRGALYGPLNLLNIKLLEPPVVEVGRVKYLLFWLQVPPLNGFWVVDHGLGPCRPRSRLWGYEITLFVVRMSFILTKYLIVFCQNVGGRYSFFSCKVVGSLGESMRKGKIFIGYRTENTLSK